MASWWAQLANCAAWLTRGSDWNRPWRRKAGVRNTPERRHQ